ncbi:hypothetical protein [Paraburkholderia sp.]|uniref:hypothetical protein n=1 Tax=Paraburkholderia sp. TaxID=1926495 RepID=UPI0025D61731|nr:hypothetical protein [Paraburkholderia sp.]
MSLQQILQRANITCAHIIDDAFDSAPTEPFGSDEAQTLIDNLVDDHFDEIVQFLNCQNEAGLLAALQDIEEVQRLFKNRRNLSPHCDGWFEEFLTDRKEKKTMLRPLIRLLQKSGVKCVKFGADYRVHRQSPEPQLVFVDLRLINNVVRVNADAAIQIYKKLKHRFKDCIPFVFLMSSLESLGDHRDQFWKEAGVFLTQFDSIQKDIFKHRAELTSIIGSYSSALPRIRALHQHIDQLESSIATAGKRIREKVRSLDMADYFVLHRNTIAAEKTDLGTYVSGLLLEYTLFEIEGSEEIWKFAKDLEGWELKDLPRSRFSLKPAALDIYSGNIVHANALLTWEETREKGPKQGYFHLGDIFFKAEEMKNSQATPKSALVLLTPACDLARPEDLRGRSMFLCEGAVEKIKPASKLTAHDGLPNTILVHPNKPDEKLQILWNKQKVQVWSVSGIDSFKGDNPPWLRVGRLRPIYAHQLQHTLMNNMSRIGTQRAPDRLNPHGIEVLVAKGNKWHALDSKSLKDSAAAATALSGDGSHILYIIDDAVVGRVRRHLEKWIKNNGKEVAAVVLKEILKQPSWSKALLYCDHPIQQNESKNPAGKDAFPIADLNGIQDSCKNAIVITTSNHQSPYSSATGGGGRDATTQPAVLVFKFVRPT